MYKVVQIQISTESAGKSAIRLHKAFREANIQSTVISLRRSINDPEEFLHLSKFSLVRSIIDTKFQSLLKGKTNKAYGLYSFPILGTDLSSLEIVRDSDIIYLHWVQGGLLSLNGITNLAKLNIPIIFILHDMWALTGGCHYSFTCTKFETICNNCQIFPTNKVFDLAKNEFKRKRYIFNKYNHLHFVSPSVWLFETAKKSQILKSKPLYYIPNVIDQEVFKPIQKETARKILGIDSNRKVIAFGAVSIDSPYKGREFLQKALLKLQSETEYQNTLVIIFGSSYRKRIAEVIPLETKFLGYLNDEYSLVVVYNAADVFIVPSLADNQPTTIMESLSCGTPVVGFNIGGIPDMIKHKSNGYLSNYKDSDDLVAGIKFCLENKLIGYTLPSFRKENIRNQHVELYNSTKK